MYYTVVAKHQKPDYNWKREHFGPLSTKEDADKIHDNQSAIALALLARGDIIDYQIETIERG